MEEQLLDLIAQFSYPAVLVLLLATGVGAPLSEDVILLSAGMVASTGRAVLVGMVVISCLGVFVSDTMLFRIGASLGARVLDQPRIRAVATPGRVDWVRRMFARYGAWTVFVARFVPGLRMPSFVLSGSFGVSQRQFWLADGAAVAIFAPAMVWLGFTFGKAALPWLRSFGGWALLAAAAVVALAVLVPRLRRRLQRAPKLD